MLAILHANQSVGMVKKWILNNVMMQIQEMEMVAIQNAKFSLVGHVQEEQVLNLAHALIQSQREV